MIKRKLLSILLAICMVLSLVPMAVFAVGEAAQVHTVDFGTGSWTVGGQTVTADKTGKIDALGVDAEITLTGFNADTMQAQVVAEDGFTAVLTVVDGKTSLSARNGGVLPEGTLEFSVVAKPTGGQGGSDPGGGNVPETHTVDFGTGSWTVGEQTVTADKEGTIDALGVDAEITLTGFNADTMQAQVVAEDGFTAVLTVVDGKTSLSARNGGGLPDGTLKFSVVAKQTGGNDPDNPPPASSGELRFQCKDNAVTGGSIFYKLNTDETFTKVGEENNQYNPITLGEATSITIRIVANEGFQLDTTRGVTLRADGMDEFHSTNENIADFTSESGYTFNLSELVGEGSVSESSFELEFGFENAGGEPGPEPGPGDEPAHGGYEGVEKIGTVTFVGSADLYINDSRMVNGNNGDSFDDVTYHYDGEGYVDFYIDCFINERYTSLKINNVDYYGQLPTPDTPEGREALLAACKGQINEFKITVPYSETYIVEANKKPLGDSDKDYMVVGNFLWSYSDNTNEDDYIDHGRMELLGVNYIGTDYSPEDLNKPGTAFDWGQDENGGSAVLPVGAEVTVKLIPDYGYQLTSFGINGGSFGTGDEQSTFTFEIRPGNAHLGAHFTPVADKVTSTAQTVTEGSIALGSSGLPGGSAQLKISDAALGEDKEAEFEAIAPSGYAVMDYLNLDLYNVYYKGSTDADNVWENEVDTLDDDATISVSLADSPLAGTVDPADIVIIHNVHDGNLYEKIPVDSYDPETNTITFKTDSFSTYAIATREADDPHTHTLTLVPAKDSTCTEAGSKAYYTCECGKWFADAAGTTEITDHSSVVIPANGHTASGWKSDEDNHWKVCTVCAAQIADSKAAHNCGEDHVCDICGKVLTECADTNKDHKCDTCGKELTQCADANKDHKCDICGKVLSECADANKDHKCDLCGKVLTECADANKDHKCDLCGKVLTECADANKDGKCDICGKNVGKYEDVKPATGEIKDITGTQEAAAEENPVEAVIENTASLESAIGVTAEQKAQGVNVWLDVSDASAVVSAAEKAVIEEAADGMQVGMYLDISLSMKVGDNAAEAVHELNRKLKISITVPEELRKADREFCIVRVHEGVPTVIEGVYDEATHTFTFETDRFSSYTLVYSDPTPLPSNPATGDNSNLALWLALLCVSCAGLLGITVYGRKKKYTAK